MSYIDPDAVITRPENVSIGAQSFIGRCHLYALDKIDIGRCTIVGDAAFICTGSHDIYSPKFALRVRPIKIGNFVWIATGAVVLPGVQIGDCAVIGAGAVVSKDVPPGSVVVGNPAKVVRTDRPEPSGFNPLSLATLDVKNALYEFAQACKSAMGVK